MSHEAGVMTIERLIRDLPIRLVLGDHASAVTDITEDHRTAKPGSLFVARRGLTTDGRRFIRPAVEAGAVAVLTDDVNVETYGATLLAAEDVIEIGGRLAERFFGDPSLELSVIGVTGTNGKTTTAHLIQQILNGSGRRCGLIGTVFVDDGDSMKPANLTTPSAIEVSRTLARMVANGLTDAVMEVSSHALAQQRTAALRFAGAVFTNLSGDHLDYHESMEAYAAAKAKLFEQLPTSAFVIVNSDDRMGERMLRPCAAGTVVRCSPSGETSADAWAKALDLSASATRVDLVGPWGMLEVVLPLVGRHNVANALQAATAAYILGLRPEEIAWALTKVTAPPGRLEPVTTPNDPFTVLVDYAHTDDALANVLQATRPIVPDGGRLIVVFGCGGDRDRTKRPRMAQIACQLADLVIITSDNPRTEDPQSIIEEILSGVSHEDRPKVRDVDPDRQAAIERIVAGACPGDVIVIAGKGHEDYQIIGTEKRHFDDREVARAAIRRRLQRDGRLSTTEVAGASI